MFCALSWFVVVAPSIGNRGFFIVSRRCKPPFWCMGDGNAGQIATWHHGAAH